MITSVSPARRSPASPVWSVNETFAPRRRSSSVGPVATAPMRHRDGQPAEQPERAPGRRLEARLAAGASQREEVDLRRHARGAQLPLEARGVLEPADLDGDRAVVVRLDGVRGGAAAVAAA